MTTITPESITLSNGRVLARAIGNTYFGDVSPAEIAELESATAADGSRIAVRRCNTGNLAGGLCDAVELYYFSSGSDRFRDGAHWQFPVSDDWLNNPNPKAWGVEAEGASEEGLCDA